MKKWIATMTVLAIALLVYGCGTGATPSSTPDIQATVDARVGMIATETAIAQAGATIGAQRSAIAATQTAMAVPPTSTLAPSSPTPATATPAMLIPFLTSTPVLSYAPTATPKPVPTPSPCTGGVLLPFHVYEAWGSDKNHYVPKGWMGDFADVEFNDNFKLDPDPSRPSVIQITYTPAGSNGWAGIYWWDPPQAEWGNIDGGFNLSCATKLTFWARGEKGGEKAEFKVGGLKGAFQDSLQPASSTGPIVLTTKWTQYTLDLAGRDLSHIIGGFVWVTNKPSNPDGATIYLDDIRFE